MIEWQRGCADAVMYLRKGFVKGNVIVRRIRQSFSIGSHVICMAWRDMAFLREWHVVWGLAMTRHRIS